MCILSLTRGCYIKLWYRKYLVKNIYSVNSSETDKFLCVCDCYAQCLIPAGIQRDGSEKVRHIFLQTTTTVFGEGQDSAETGTVKTMQTVQNQAMVADAR